MKKVLWLLPLVLLFFSCVGIETETTFNRDGSGTMTFTYKLGNILMQMGEEGSDIELPISEATLRESLEDAHGVTLKSVETWADEDDTYVSATVDFESVDEFYAQDEYNDMAAVLYQDGGDFVYRQLLSEGWGDISQEEKEENLEATAMMAPYFEGYNITIILHTPRRIKSATMGDISADGKTLTFSIPMLDVQGFSEETYLEVRW